MAFSMNGTSGASGPSAEINVTPLIDVLLVLLIIFMVIVPVAPRGLDATALTPDKHPDAQRPEPPVLVRVDGEAESPTYKVDGASVTRGQLGPRVEKLLASRADRQMLVQADPRLDFRTVADVVDAGRAAGADTVGIVTPGSSH